MGNMSYCRFENTMDDLMDCIQNIYRKAENDRDEQSRQNMIALFKDVAESFDGDIVGYSENQY